MKHLIIFIKNPVKGKVKTRLAAGVGDEKALDIYIRLLAHTRSITRKVDCNKHLFYSDSISENDDWEIPGYAKYLQEGEDLGARMKNAFQEVFLANKDDFRNHVIIIGSDCPDLDEVFIAEAFDVLKDKDIVIGPSMDGGYYLMGMNQQCDFLFENIPWSTESVFDDTIRNLEERGMSYTLLKALNDIDTIEDYESSNLKK